MSPFVTVMIDETTDITNKEQVTIVIRRIDEDLGVHEEFLGLYTVSAIDAATLFGVVKDILCRLNLSWNNLRGQCYDGCSTMSGSRSGVAKRVQEEEPCAIFTHCYSHSLNIAELQHLPVEHKDNVFSSTGFSNWKDALSKFRKHQSSVAHHEAVNLIQTTIKM